MDNGALDNIKRGIKEKQVAVIKEAVQLTFEKLEECEAQKSKIQENIKLLKHDLFDLKDGRLDRILERQAINEEVKSVSVIVVSKPASTGNANVSSWYEDYDFNVIRSGIPAESCKVNNSVTKIHASGSYKLKDGSIRYL